MKQLSKKYNIKESEKKWQEYWVDNKVFKFDWSDTKQENIFSVDTPPPHVSGVLHMGHIFGYSQMDCITRYQRMKGMNVFYPTGYDDNGLPSEKYVEKKIKRKSKEMERGEFVKICDKEIKDAEKLIRDLFIKAGYSFDWDEEYRTISDTSRRVSQMSFIDLFNKGHLYQKEEPVIWDVIDQTALAQTEAEEKEFDSQMNYLRFTLVEKGAEAGKDLEIMTTRPELLPACVAVFYHPEDSDKYEGKEAITPLGVRVPMLADESVEREKGTGVMMCCTFGDNADVEKWKKYNLDLRIILDEKGCLTFNSINNLQELDTKYKQELEGLFVEKARKRILELLKEDNKLMREPVAIKHSVKVGERSKYPVEIIVKKQWSIKVLNIKEELHAKAREVKWHPEWMEGRIHSWIDGLSWDWCISRQRFFGVPIPVWYSKKPGEEGKPILPSAKQLPVDPTADLPEGYTADEVCGETDVFDTWFTSSVSPQLSTHGVTEELCSDKKRFEDLKLPFSLRPQGHDIIRTWAFCTIVKSYYHQNIIPWTDVMVNGFCLAEDGTKMSKSIGNVIDPIKVIDEFGTDAVRYWTSNSMLGTDTSFNRNIMKTGQKLITKLWNCAKFGQMHFDNVFGADFSCHSEFNSESKKNSNEILNQVQDDKTSKGKERTLPTTTKSDIESGKIYEKVDLWILSRLAETISRASSEFEKFEYAKARNAVEDFFWNDFCDNYLEIVKIRCYGASGKKYEGMNLSDAEIQEITRAQHSGVYTIYHCLNTIMKLFAPFIPHITEEIFSCLFEDEFNATKSLHARGNWPKVEDFALDSDLIKLGRELIEIIAEVRKYKSEQGLAMNAEIEKLEISSFFEQNLNSTVSDLKNVTGAKEINLSSGEFSVNISK